MPWLFLALMTVYGILSLVFAFVPPPERFRSLFKVPAIFVFLPDRWVMPAGRIALGVGSLALVGYIAVQVLRVGR
jgi:hypothetical protein